LGEKEAMTPEELSAAVALVCGKDRRFEVNKVDYNAPSFRWKVTMWRKKRGTENNEVPTWVATGWSVHGHTKAEAMEKAERDALTWADQMERDKNLMVLLPY
jgi:hypothetical protein